MIRKSANTTLVQCKARRKNNDDDDDDGELAPIVHTLICVGTQWRGGSDVMCPGSSSSSSSSSSTQPTAGHINDVFQAFGMSPEFSVLVALLTATVIGMLVLSAGLYIMRSEILTSKIPVRTMGANIMGRVLLKLILKLFDYLKDCLIFE
ncbi:hypothetical protein HELRODRAFT_177892 [Helobdella robusta]|uniref:Uncharacterized protein n=1 Tax=Helobdella robusta TaxID=6412 RepID=T1FCF6_HELRO|nr:hypothetical protein HELRODRAFT_177892 [Helobdella robusta]ESN97471.1 hypothetical protein HELRODRAFT_177892 [Helobdella robusta]